MASLGSPNAPFVGSADVPSVEMETESDDNAGSTTSESEGEGTEYFFESTSMTSASEGDFSSSDERDAQLLEGVLDCAYSNRFNQSLDPAQRDSMLFYDKDFDDVEDLLGAYS